MGTIEERAIAANCRGVALAMPQPKKLKTATNKLIAATRMASTRSGGLDVKSMRRASTSALADQLAVEKGKGPGKKVIL
jgi:hypothetical protein